MKSIQKLLRYFSLCQSGQQDSSAGEYEDFMGIHQIAIEPCCFLWVKILKFQSDSVIYGFLSYLFIMDVVQKTHNSVWKVFVPV